MHIAQLSSLLSLYLFSMQPGDPVTLISEADAAYHAEDYAESARLYAAAIEAGATTPVAPFNAACCYGLLGKPDDAFAWLDKSLDMGWRDVRQLTTDTDLASLHDDPRWAKAVARCNEENEKFRKSIKLPELRDELLKRMEEDQRIRKIQNHTQEDFAEWQRIDADNTTFMKTVIDKHGWPGKSMVGSDGALAAFLMVQHADADPAFQRKCLPLLTEAAEKGEARLSDMAYLTDRVLVAEGKPQRYGSQFHMVNGELVPRPIEDEANVDARRKEVGLSTLAAYAKQMGAR